MNTRLASVPSAEMTDTRPTFLERFARRLVLSRLESLEVGQVVVSEGGEHFTFGDVDDLAQIRGRQAIEQCRDQRTECERTRLVGSLVSAAGTSQQRQGDHGHGNRRR